MAQITIKELNDYFISEKNGSMELFFKYINEEFVLILYLEKQKVSFQKLSKENVDKEKYYYNINDLLNEEYIDKEKLIEIFDKFDFYNDYIINTIKKHNKPIRRVKIGDNLLNKENINQMINLVDEKIKEKEIL